MYRNRILLHILSWLAILLILTLVFRNSLGSPLFAYYFVSMLFPIIAGTYYFLNYFLIPRYLFTGRYFRFVLYFFYTLVVSTYLEMIVMMISFIFIADYQMGEMKPYGSDIIVMAMVLYLIVFSGSFLRILLKYLDTQKRIQALKHQSELKERGFFEVRAERKKMRIPYESVLYIESLSDYVKVHTGKGKQIITKERISHLEKQLPDNFLRIHRSFIVNVDKIEAFKYDFVQIEGTELTISRSYKKIVSKRLKQAQR